MYVILPGKLGYAKSWKFLDQARIVISEAEKIQGMMNLEEMAVDDMSPKQREAYSKYTDISEELLNFYIEYSDRPLDEEDANIFAGFCILLASNESFYELVKDYFKTASEFFNELVRTSSEKMMRIRGADVFLGLYAAVWVVSEEIGRSPCAILDTMSDLIVEE